MQSLPYEILQHVASSLLPRYQCRLAITSRFCYRYLYTPLLAWHALKHPIEIPKHKYKQYDGGLLSLIQANKKIVLYESRKTSRLIIFNLTTCRVFYNIWSPMNFGNITSFFRDHADVDIFNGCYRYMHINCITCYIDTKSPLLRLPILIIYKIYSMLDKLHKKRLRHASCCIRWIVN